MSSNVVMTKKDNGIASKIFESHNLSFPRKRESIQLCDWNVSTRRIILDSRFRGNDGYR